MGRNLLFFLLLLLLMIAAGPVSAQAPSPATPSPSPGAPFEPKPPIIQFILAGAGLALILTILCMPTRKRMN